MPWVLRITAIALLALTPKTVSAECSCLWKGSFAEVHWQVDRVVSGTVIATKGNSIDLGVESDLRGGDAFDIIRIWMKTGDYCRPDVENFPPGTRWVMALHKIKKQVPGGFNPDTPNISYGRVGDYSLSNCGGFWLSRVDDVVTGNLVNGPRFDHEPQMTPVLMELIEAHVMGRIEDEALLEASRDDPALRELKLDTKAFVRGDTELDANQPGGSE
ncbi:MAG: delta-aminolevulinic acid dehydratase [Halieaceae bacterium]|nr:delta-aminolevulinic acid dehydratase [Halieaceae bacterium]